jgi:peptide chain release factor subunit 1
MISRQDLKDLLAANQCRESRIVSVYVNVDQARAVNLNRGFEAAFRSLVQSVERSLDEAERPAFLAAARRAAGFLADYEPAGKSLVFFGDAVGPFSWHRSLGIPLESQVRWGPRPFVRPLLEARDEFQRYGVILTDRARARLFIVFLGSIQEEQEALAEAQVKRFDASGTDQLRSQMNFQRKADEHARWHLKRVAEMMDRLAASERFDRLVLGGTHEVIGELRGLLSERLKKSVIGTVTLSMEAGVNEILRETVALLRQVERDGEAALVGDLLTAAAKNHQAVIGIEGTLAALGQGRIHQLVYSDGMSMGGSECLECGKAFVSRESCPFCSGPVRKVDDLVEAVAVRVFEEGGDIEQLKGPAAERLGGRGEGMGAFLRF